MAARRAAVVQHVLWLTLQRESVPALAASSARSTRMFSTDQSDSAVTPSRNKLRANSKSTKPTPRRWKRDRPASDIDEELKQLAIQFAQEAYQEPPDPEPPLPLQPSPDKLLAMDPTTASSHARMWLSSQPTQLSTAAKHVLRAHLRQVIDHISPRRAWRNSLSLKRKHVLLELWSAWLRVTADLSDAGALSPIKGKSKPEYRRQWFDSLFLAILIRPAPVGPKDPVEGIPAERKKERRALPTGEPSLNKADEQVEPRAEQKVLSPPSSNGEPLQSAAGLDRLSVAQPQVSSNAFVSEVPRSKQEEPARVDAATKVTSVFPQETPSKRLELDGVTAEAVPAAPEEPAHSAQSSIHLETHGRVKHGRRTGHRPGSRYNALPRHRVNRVPGALSSPPPDQKLRLRHRTLDEGRAQALEGAVAMLKILGIEPTRFQLQMVLQRTPSKVIFDSACSDEVLPGASAANPSMLARTLARSLQLLLSPHVTIYEPLSTVSLQKFTTPTPPAAPQKNAVRDKRFLSFGATEKCLDELEAAHLAGKPAPFWSRARVEMRPGLLKEVDRYFWRLDEALQSGTPVVPSNAQCRALWLLLRDTLLRSDPKSSRLRAPGEDVVQGWDLNDPLVILRLMIGQPDPRTNCRPTKDVLERVYSSIIRIAVAASRTELIGPVTKVVEMLAGAGTQKLSAWKAESTRAIPSPVPLSNFQAHLLPVPTRVLKYLAGAISYPDDMRVMLPLFLRIPVVKAREHDLYVAHTTKAQHFRRKRKRVVEDRLVNIAKETDRRGLGRELEGGSAVQVLQQLFRRWDPEPQHGLEPTSIGAKSRIQ